MSGLEKTSVKGSNNHEMLPNADGSINVKATIQNPLPTPNQDGSQNVNVTNPLPAPNQDGSLNVKASIVAGLPVDNVRQQVLAAADRQQQIIYADFGTPNQRITQVNYSSGTVFPGTVVRKSITYTLVSGRYRRDAVTWFII